MSESMPRRLRVLMAHEDEEFALELSDLLKARDIEVRLEQGDSVLRATVGFRPDVFVAQVGLSGTDFDPFDLARQVRHWAEGEGRPLLTVAVSPPDYPGRSSLLDGEEFDAHFYDGQPTDLLGLVRSFADRVREHVLTHEFIDGESLGSGGFGEVCVCTNRGRRYAKKRLLPFALPDAEERFRREVRILSRLNHPNIVRVVVQNLVTRPYWYVMPLYRASLEGELPQLGGDESRIGKVFRAVLDGVEYAHAEGVVHRDLKPANVLLNGDADVAVSDFGLGRIVDAESTRQTQTGLGLGTLFYAAPEQLDDAKRADRRCDIYALGRVLYVLHTGPLRSLHMDLARVPSNVRVIVSKCTQPDPNRRFQTVAELKRAWLAATGGIVLTSAAGRVDELIREYAAVPFLTDSVVDELTDLLVQYQDDADLLHNAVMTLPTDALDDMARRRHDDARLLVRRFSDETAGHSYGFSYTDEIARRCEALYRAVSDFEIRADLLYCVMQVGFEHDRYYVKGLFGRLLEEPKQPGEGFAVVERLRDAGTARLGEVAREVSLARLDRTIRDFLSDYLDP